MGIPKSLGLRHIKTIGIVVAIHSFIYGLGYFFGVGGFPNTILYGEVSTLLNPELFGATLTLTSLALVWGYLGEKARVISAASTFQSFVWLFATFVYILDKDWLVAIAIAFVWCVLSGYTAYAYKSREREENEWLIRTYLDI